MGDHERRQARDPPENGFFPMLGQDLLCQIPAARRPGPDSRSDRGPQGMFRSLTRVHMSSIRVLSFTSDPIKTKPP